ncbi:MAG: type II secretion system protein [Nitrospinae bacterium]|nr:type II secretion system protein [Nitrospinota bacterium]
MIKNLFSINDERGFTLIEIIMAITLIGIAVPTIMIPFSGLSDTKNPEYTIQGSFIGQQRIEEIAGETTTDALTTCNEPSPSADYTLSCAEISVDAADPDTSTSSTFAKKITLTVSRGDGAMSPLTFTTLIVEE